MQLLRPTTLPMGLRRAATIAVGKAPAGVAASDRAGTVFVAERDDDSVALVDVNAQRVRVRARVGSHPFALLFDAPRQRLYTLNVQSDDVSVLDTSDPNRLDAIATVKVGKAPYGAALAADGTLFYVANQHDDTVSVLDARSGQALGSVATGQNSRGFGAFIGAPTAP